MINKCMKLVENIIRFIFEKILRIELSETVMLAVIQFVKFGIIGVSNTVISYGVYIIFLYIFQSVNWFKTTDYLIAQFMGFVISVLWSFYWNNKIVFEAGKGKRNLLYTLMKTYLSYAFTGVFLNSILSVLWVEVLGLSKLLAPIFNLLISVPINFLMNKFWAFKSKK